MPDNEQAEWLSGAKVAQYFSVSPMTIFRWERHPTLGFPKPARVLSFKYFRRDEIEAWARAMVVNRAAKAASTKD
jgi:hypothetical protein